MDHGSRAFRDSFYANPGDGFVFEPADILPFDRAYTPSPTRDQTPSPAATPPGLGRSITYGNNMQNSYVNFSRTSPQSYHRISKALSDIEEVDTTPRGSRYPEPMPTTLASSPTLRDTGAMDTVDWKAHSRKLSDSSSSVHSEELANMKWPGFDSAHGADVESEVLEEEKDKYGALPKVADSDDLMLDDPWLGPRAGEDDEDLLSKRADMILANAKKRLNVLEGNLRGARHSLLATPALPKTPPYITAFANFSRDRTSPGARSQRLSSNSSISPIFGHARMQSDTSPAPILSLPPRLPLQKRSSSALGSFAGGLNSLDRSVSLRGVRSQEVMRESRLQTWMEETPTRNPIQSSTGRSMSQQNLHRSRTPSVESLRRPASSASDIRAQMDELKGRISSLKERAHEDRIKRWSVNSLRSPSPFTSSDKWHPDGYKGSSRSVDWSQNSSPVAKQDGFSSTYCNNNSEPRSSPPRVFDATEYTGSTYEDTEDLLGDIKEEPEELDDPSTPSTTVYTDGQKILIGPHDLTPDELGDKSETDLTAKAQFEDEYPDYEDGMDSESLDGQSEYHEAAPVLAERHEDRADAFDYEHFFLHSAMGSFTRDRRESSSSSSSSEGSLETTRPATPFRRASTDHEPEDPRLLHRRSLSAESMSTVQSFATAAEEVDYDGDSDDGPDPLDLATGHLFVPKIHTPQPLSPQSSKRPSRNSRRLDSAVHMLASDDGKLDLDTDAGYTSPSVKQRPVSALVSSLLEIHNMVAGTEMKESDTELVEAVVKSLRTTCITLQSLAEDDYERRVLRRRLDEARRALDGEDATLDG